MYLSFVTNKKFTMSRIHDIARKYLIQFLREQSERGYFTLEEVENYLLTHAGTIEVGPGRRVEQQLSVYVELGGLRE